MFICSLRASFPGYSGGWVGKGRRACNYVSGIRISARKTAMEMLIGGNDISNDVTTLSSCFLMFVYIRARFPLVADWRKSDSSVDGEPHGNWIWNSNFGDYVVCKFSFLFPPAVRASRRAARGLVYLYDNTFKRNSFRGVV